MKTSIKIRTSEESLIIATKEARAFLRNTYNLNLDIPIVENKKVKKLNGSFKYNYNKITKKETPICIELNTEVLKYASIEKMLDVVRHECVHYALLLLGKNNSDGAEDFEKELVKYNICSNYNKSIGVQEKVYYQAVLECTKCKAKIKTRRRTVNKTALSKLCSSCCKADLKFVDRYIYNGKEYIKLKQTQSL